LHNPGWCSFKIIKKNIQRLNTEALAAINTTFDPPYFSLNNALIHQQNVKVKKAHGKEH
jgi:hypothetical protein